MLWAIIDWNFGVKYFWIYVFPYYGISLNKHPKMFGWNWPTLFSFFSCSPFAWGEIWHFIRVLDNLVEIDIIWPESKQQKWLSFTQWCFLSFIQWCCQVWLKLAKRHNRKQRDNEHQQHVLRKAHQNHWKRYLKSKILNK